MENNEGTLVKPATAMTENENRSLRRSSRSSNSNLKSLCKSTVQNEKGYKLDRNKAMEKKSEACLREHIQYTLKPGKNFVAEFSTAAYELTKSSIKDILQHNGKIKADFCVNYEEDIDKSGAKVEVRYKLFQRKRDGVPGCYSKLTINLYNTTSRLMANGPRVDIMTDIIMKDLLSILQEKYHDIAITDQNIRDSIAFVSEGQRQMHVQNCNGEIQAPSAEHSESAEKDEIVSQSEEPIVIDETDIDMDNDYVECPVCDEGAMSGVIQCEECSMWLHYKCAGLPEDKICKIPDSCPFICISCNDQKLYEDPVVNKEVQPPSQKTLTNDPVQMNRNAEKNKPSLTNASQNPKIVTGINTQTANIQIKQNDIDTEKGLDASKTMKIDTKTENPIRQTPVDKLNKPVKTNSAPKKRPANNNDNSEKDNKTLIIQLERQIREKDKTINLLRQLNDSHATEPPNRIEIDSQSNPTEQQETQCKQRRVEDSCKSCEGTENRLRQMEHSMFQNMTLMTNCNVQMATQMQTLSNQVMMQSQNMILQQQLLNATSMNHYMRGMTQQPAFMLPFNQTLTMQQPMIYQRPIYNPPLFYHRPAMMNSHVYVPMQRPVPAQTAHVQQQQQQQPAFVNPPVETQHQHVEIQREAQREPAQTPTNYNQVAPDPSRECNSQRTETQTPNLHLQQLSISSEAATTLKHMNCENTINDSIAEVLGSKELNSAPSPGHSNNSHSQLDRSEVTEDNSAIRNQSHSDPEKNQANYTGKDSSPFLCIPGRKHIPPDHQELLIPEKQTIRQ